MSRQTLILIHGLWEHPILLKYIGCHLMRAGYDVKYFKYRSVLWSMPKNIEKLKEFLREFDSNEIHLIGHSLGGLISLELIKKYPDLGVRRCVILAAPVNGSLVVKELGKYSIIKKMFGASFFSLCCGVKYTSDLGVGVIVGSGGMGLGQFFAQLPGPHDGAISKDEASLVGAADQIVLPVSHFSMLFSRKVITEIINFIKNGAFRKKSF